MLKYVTDDFVRIRIGGETLKLYWAEQRVYGMLILEVIHLKTGFRTCLSFILCTRQTFMLLDNFYLIILKDLYIYLCPELMR